MNNLCMQFLHINYTSFIFTQSSFIFLGNLLNSYYSIIVDWKYLFSYVIVAPKLIEKLYDKIARTHDDCEEHISCESFIVR